jgi:hypothetical protein
MLENENRAAGGSASAVSENLFSGDSDIALPTSENQQDGAPPAIDWDAIQVAYEAGEISVREIGRQHHVSDTAIAKKAKAEGWHRGLRQPANHEAPPLQTEPQTSAEVSNKSVDEVDDDGEFKWAPENPDVIIPGMPSIAIYLNAWNQVVIRQEGGCPRCGDGDTFIRVDQKHLWTLTYRLERLLKQCQRSTG